MRHPWTLDELILVLDFYVTWGVNPKDTESQFQDLLKLVCPHPSSSVWWQIKELSRPRRETKRAHGIQCQMDVEGAWEQATAT